MKLPEPKVPGVLSKNKGDLPNPHLKCVSGGGSCLPTPHLPGVVKKNKGDLPKPKLP